MVGGSIISAKIERDQKDRLRRNTEITALSENLERKISTIGRLNSELKSKVELRTAELALGAADIMIKESAGLESLRKQQELVENRLKAAVSDLEANHQNRLADLSADYAEKKKLQDDMYMERMKKLKSEARKTQTGSQSGQVAKLPLEKFIAKHLLETFSNPEFVRKVQQREEKKAVASALRRVEGRVQAAGMPCATLSSSSGRQKPVRAVSEKNSFLVNRANAVCTDETQKSSQHYAERLRVLEERHSRR